MGGTYLSFVGVVNSLLHPSRSHPCTFAFFGRPDCSTLVVFFLGFMGFSASAIFPWSGRITAFGTSGYATSWLISIGSIVGSIKPSSVGKKLSMNGYGSPEFGS